jgi:hypothetical protein
MRIPKTLMLSPNGRRRMPSYDSDLTELYSLRLSNRIESCWVSAKTFRRRHFYYSLLQGSVQFVDNVHQICRFVFIVKIAAQLLPVLLCFCRHGNLSCSSQPRCYDASPWINGSQATACHGCFRSGSGALILWSCSQENVPVPFRLANRRTQCHRRCNTSRKVVDRCPPCRTFWPRDRRSAHIETLFHSAFCVHEIAVYSCGRKYATCKFQPATAPSIGHFCARSGGSLLGPLVPQPAVSSRTVSSLRPEYQHGTSYLLLQRRFREMWLYGFIGHEGSTSQTRHSFDACVASTRMRTL